MEPGFFGTEQVTEEDRAYKGSRFSEVRDAIFANPYQRVWGGAGEPPLPVYDVNLPGVLRGILPFGQPHFFRQAVARAVDARSDLRWGADQRKELEHLCRYITRPAIANERLKRNRAGDVVLQLKSTFKDGTTHIVMSPLEFMQRLAALVPRPRLHLIRFHGVLAPGAKLRCKNHS